MNSDFISNAISLYSTESPDLVSAVSGSIVLTPNVTYCGRYYCLGNLLIQFNDSPNCVETSGSTMPTISFPYKYDVTPYSVIMTNYNQTSMTFDASSIYLGSNYESAMVNFMAIGPRPAVFYPIVPYSTTGFVSLAAYNVLYNDTIYDLQVMFNDVNASNSITFYKMPSTLLYIVNGGGAGGQGGEAGFSGASHTYNGGNGGEGGNATISSQGGAVLINQQNSMTFGAGGAGGAGGANNSSGQTFAAYGSSGNDSILYINGTTVRGFGGIGGGQGGAQKNGGDGGLGGSVYTNDHSNINGIDGSASVDTVSGGGGGGGGASYIYINSNDDTVTDYGAAGFGGLGGGMGGEGGVKNNGTGSNGLTNLSITGGGNGGGGGGGGLASYNTSTSSDTKNYSKGGTGGNGSSGNVVFYIIF